MIVSNRLANNENNLNVSSPVGDFGGNLHYLFHRRQRGEKRTIPDEQKDEKYFERRKRNNEAAKKSRDARKIREDRVSYIWLRNTSIAIALSIFNPHCKLVTVFFTRQLK